MPREGAEHKLRIRNRVRLYLRKGNCPLPVSYTHLDVYKRQMDTFIGELVATLSIRKEKTVLVLYGDHLPALGLESRDMKSGNLYRTRYVIWDNFGLEKQDQDRAAYQRSA